MAPQVQWYELTVPDNRFTTNIVMGDLERRAKYQGCHWVMQCAGVFELVQLDGNEISTFARFE